MYPQPQMMHPQMPMPAPEGEEVPKMVCTFHEDSKERLIAISRSIAVTISDVHPGIVVIRPYTQAELMMYPNQVSNSRILDACFSNPNSNLIAILTEDQLITIWRVGDKCQLEKVLEQPKIENAMLTKIRWNPFNNDQIICFSDTQIFILENAAPTFEILLPFPIPEGIADVFFFTKTKNYFLVLPKDGNKLWSVYFDKLGKKLVSTDLGIKLVQPVHIFMDEEKDKYLRIMDAKEFKEVTFKLEGGMFNATLHTIALNTFLPSGLASFIPYYNSKSILFYVVGPTKGDYVILKHKKKKLNHVASGIIPPPVPQIEGFIATTTTKPDVSIHTFYFYNPKGIFVFNAKKSQAVPSPGKEVRKEAKKEAKKIAKKEEKRKGKERRPSPTEPPHAMYPPGMPAFPVEMPRPIVDYPPIMPRDIPGPPEQQVDLKALIKKEIDEGIKTVVLPVIESHMKHYAEGFQQLVAREVAMLKQTVENETAKMQNTGKVFEEFMEKMLNISSRFTGSLEKQMRDLAITAAPKPTPSQPTPPMMTPQPQTSPFAMPGQGFSMGGYPRPAEGYARPPEYGYPQRRMEEHGRSPEYGYPQMSGYIGGNLPSTQGK